MFLRCFASCTRHCGIFLWYFSLVIEPCVAFGFVLLILLPLFVFRVAVSKSMTSSFLLEKMQTRNRLFKSLVICGAGYGGIYKEFPSSLKSKSGTALGYSLVGPFDTPRKAFSFFFHHCPRTSGISEIMSHYRMA